MNEHEQLTALCVRLGATSAQAATMAEQLLKRCEQLAAERAWPRERAMAHLLELLTKSRSGQPVPGFEGGPPPTAQSGG
jgi:hypothetical protein